MSIPKEPRQLMINLMYLVLTAMLALSLSAEIFNAFYTLDKGNINSEAIVTKANVGILGGIQAQAKAYPNDKNKEILSKAEQVASIVDDFNSYIAEMRTEMIDLSGGMDSITDHPKGFSDSAIPTRMLVEGLEQPGKPKEEPRGEELMKKIMTTRDALLALMDEKDRDSYASSLPLNIEMPPAKAVAKAKAKGSDLTWQYFNFNQMPVAAVLPMLSKYQVDAKSSATAVLNYFLEKVKGKIIIMDKYNVIASAPKGYLLEGQKYEADIFLGAYSSQVKGMSVTVGGKGLSVKDGKAKFTETAGSIGTKDRNITIKITNPLTNETKTHTGKLSYEVGQASIAIALDKMNVFYVGVDNPISLSASGIRTSSIKVSAPGLGLKKVGKGKYIVRPKEVRNKVYITVSGDGQNVRKEFRVKRIPTPSATIGTNKTNWKGGQMKNGVMKAQRAIFATLENFDFDARCSIQGFTMTYVKRREDGVVVMNKGGKFSAETKRLVSKAKPGDRYFFENIKGRCPGDKVARALNTVSFKIK